MTDNRFKQIIAAPFVWLGMIILLVPYYITRDWYQNYDEWFRELLNEMQPEDDD